MTNRQKRVQDWIDENAHEIDELRFPVVLFNLLVRSGFRTRQSIQEATDEQLLHLRNFGAESLRKVRQATSMEASNGHD